MEKTFEENTRGRKGSDFLEIEMRVSIDIARRVWRGLGLPDVARWVLLQFDERLRIRYFV